VITCPVCGLTSGHPMDEQEGYCGLCHAWTSRSCPATPDEARSMARPDGRCLLCAHLPEEHPYDHPLR
jgi:hypothetical protein